VGWKSGEETGQKDGGGGGGVELNEGKQVVSLFVPELLLLLGSVEFPLQQSSWRGWCCAVYRGKRWTGKDVRQDVGGKV
jgi:hypothetical protein